MVNTDEVSGGALVETAIAEAPLKAQRQLGLALSWPWITSASVSDVACWYWPVTCPVHRRPSRGGRLIRSATSRKIA
jgi:hypothetical protein